MRNVAIAAVLLLLPATALAGELDRDPFQPPPEATPTDVVAIGGPTLTSVTLEQVRVEGVVTGFEDPRAIVVLPDGTSAMIRLGTQMGTRGGIVTRISTDAIVVRETMTSPDAPPVVRLTSLAVDPS